jgi:hypothetical protein
MGTVHRIVKHRSVLDRKGAQDISQEKEMQALVEVNRGMTEEEKARTVKYIKDQKED